MENLSRSEAVRLFREQWNWLAENPYKSKYDFAPNGNKDLMRDVENGCFICEWVYNHSPGKNHKNCSRCPIAWPYGAFCMSETSPLKKWRMAQSSDETSLLALEVANLPEKGAVKC